MYTANLYNPLAVLRDVVIRRQPAKMQRRISSNSLPGLQTVGRGYSVIDGQ